MSAISRQYGALLLSLGLTGCAGWSQNIPVSPHEKIRIAILPVENVAQIGKLTEIVSQPAALPEEGEEQVVIQRHLRQVTADMTRRVEDRLSSSPCFLVVPNAEVSAAMDVYATHLPPDGLSDEDLRWLGSATRAEVVLQIRLSGYGQIKRKWLVYLIGSGVKERDTLLVGIVVVPKDSGTKSLKDLNGATMAFPSPLAFAATTLPQLLLKQMGVSVVPKLRSVPRKRLPHRGAWSVSCRWRYP